MPSNLVLPRPGKPFAPEPPIPGPSESFFTSVFGTLLPPAQHLQTRTGKVAYYSIPPTTSNTSPTNHAQPSHVLFIHGVQTPAIGMLPLARALHTSFPSSRFVLLDLWGHGLSDAPIAAYTASLFHSLIDDLLDHLSWPRVHLVGFSFGGALTVGYVASRPQRVSGFTLIAPAGLIRRDVFSAEQRALLDGDGDEESAEKWVLDVLEDGELVVPEDWRERVEKGEVVAQAVKEWQMREHEGHTAAVVAVFRDGGVMDQDEVFATVVETSVRNLVVLGELDGVVSEEDLVKLGFKDIKVVKGAGHGVVRENVEEVKGLVEGFWRGF
ncbi:alpha/beta-hydrolase [Setomelanomma holmii]|uniref:Alpha/beta-hydrolase n=1 Tax=Setomelanomma holmii TaxID=210430 RepID=A0A9P4HC02_9PLEO|nr:alpha/beta-hydrolase [Setomelanomma holmii]